MGGRPAALVVADQRSACKMGYDTGGYVGGYVCERCMKTSLNGVLRVKETGEYVCPACKRTPRPEAATSFRAVPGSTEPSVSQGGKQWP